MLPPSLSALQTDYIDILPVLIASATSVAGVVLAVVQSSDVRTGWIRVTLTVLSLVASLLAWALVSTVFAFKYARLYYLNDASGIDFKAPSAPAYSDFAYVHEGRFSDGGVRRYPDGEREVPCSPTDSARSSSQLPST